MMPMTTSNSTSVNPPWSLLARRWRGAACDGANFIGSLSNWRNTEERRHWFDCQTVYKSFSLGHINPSLNNNPHAILIITGWTGGARECVVKLPPTIA
jgi:hypothetical protein